MGCQQSVETIFDIPSQSSAKGAYKFIETAEMRFINDVNKDGMSFLVYVIIQGIEWSFFSAVADRYPDTEKTFLLFNPKNGNEAIFLTAYNSLPDEKKNEYFVDKETALSFAATRLMIPETKKLCAIDADVNYVDNRGASILDRMNYILANNRNKSSEINDVIRILKKHGAKTSEELGLSRPNKKEEEK